MAVDRQQLLDLYFIEARSKLVDVAAFLDRLERASGQADFRLNAFEKALTELSKEGKNRAERVLLALSDLTTEPAASASTKGATGAPPP